MPSYDFEVDFQALIDASKHTGESIQYFKDNDVDDLLPSESEVEQGTLWSAIDEFRERWEEGMNNMMRDVEEISGRIGKVAGEYATYDSETSELFKKVAGDMSAINVRGR